MVPSFLVPETEIGESGTGPAVDLGAESAGTLLITLGITHIIEQESLDVAIEGSADGTEWLTRPLASFSQKFYCGNYQLLLNLNRYPEIRYLRARWTVNRWGKGDLKPLFGFYVFVQVPAVRTMAGSAA